MLASLLATFLAALGATLALAAAALVRVVELHVEHVISDNPTLALLLGFAVLVLQSEPNRSV